jgi:hypothetical protein
MAFQYCKEWMNERFGHVRIFAITLAESLQEQSVASSKICEVAAVWNQDTVLIMSVHGHLQESGIAMLTVELGFAENIS